MDKNFMNEASFLMKLMVIGPFLIMYAVYLAYYVKENNLVSL